MLEKLAKSLELYQSDWIVQGAAFTEYVRQKSGISICLKTDPWNIGQLNASCCPLAHMTD
jgi:hypothetical protein